MLLDVRAMRGADANNYHMVRGNLKIKLTSNRENKYQRDNFNVQWLKPK